MARYSRFASFSHVREDILAEHLEESEFLFLQRDNALCSPEYTLPDLAKLEARLDAHLDGLAVGGDRTVLLLAPALLTGDEHQTAAAAAGLLSVDSAAAREAVLAAVGGAGEPDLKGIIRALCYLPLAAPIRDALRGWLKSGGDADELAAAWDVLSFHHDGCPAEPASGAGHESPLVRRAVALAGGRLGRAGSHPLRAALLADSDEGVRQAAWTAAARTGDPGLLDALRGRLRTPAGARGWEMLLLARLGDLSDVPRFTEALAEPDSAESAAAGLATLGYAAAVPALLEAMARPQSAAAAGAAFARIAGGDLPLLAVPEPSESEEEESFEEMRPLPDPVRCGDLWTRLRETLPADQRLRGGEVLRTEAWLERPEQGDLLSRSEEITRLRYRQPGAFSNLELDAPSARQQAAATEVAS